MFCVTVMFTLTPGAALRFLSLVRQNAAQSLRDEPGCLRFDVCHAPERPDQVFLYELYETADAFQAHLQMPHFKAFDAACGDLVADKQITTFSEVWT